MGSSKEEAIQEKELAETLIRLNNYNGAREKLLRARNLFPQLENINPMITVCNILCAASPHSQSQSQSQPLTTDWYWVLQIDANADKTRISSKYHALSDSLKPIKNTFPGTNSALSILREAFSVLSDPRKRLLFDAQRFTTWSPSPDKTDHPSTDLLPPTPTKSIDKRPIASSCALLKPDVCYYDFGSNKKRGVFAKDQIWATYDEEALPRRYARVNWVNTNEHLPFRLGVSWLRPVPPNMDEKKWCEVGLPVACGHFDLKGDNAVITKSAVFSHGISRVQGVEETEGVDICPKKGDVWAIFDDWKPFDWCRDPKIRKGGKCMMVEIITGYSKHAGVSVTRLVKVQGFKSIFRRCIDAGGGSTFTIPANHLLRFSHYVPAFRFKGGEISGVSEGMLELDPAAMPDGIIEGDVGKPSGGGSPSDSSSFTDYVPGSPPVSLEPEAVSTKCKWSRKDFTKDQIWAVYNGQDSMPRQYVTVNNVISGTEICATFLDPYPKYADEICWMQENLPFVCGIFKLGRTTIIKMQQFSHVVIGESCTKSSLYKIYPRKGEVWAVYKDWHPKWKNCDYKRHQCQIVEVLSDFFEDGEMKVASLVEVNDYMTFFQRQICNGFELIRTISRMEMLSFSHQIPCFVIPGIETHGFPKGTLHLEPEALSHRLPISSC